MLCCFRRVRRMFTLSTTLLVNIRETLGGITCKQAHSTIPTDPTNPTHSTKSAVASPKALNVARANGFFKKMVILEERLQKNKKSDTQSFLPPSISYRLFWHIGRCNISSCCQKSCRLFCRQGISFPFKSL